LPIRRGNRLLDRFEAQTGIENQPVEDSHARLYYLSQETFEEAEAFIAKIFEEQLGERRWRDSLNVGTGGRP